MTRVKRGVIAAKTRRSVLKKVKGFRFGHSTKEKQAYEALVHAGKYSFAHRKDKKSDFRKLWTTRIGASLKEFDISYSRFIDILTKKSIKVDRKIMAELAEKKPEVFSRFVNQILIK